MADKLKQGQILDERDPRNIMRPLDLNPGDYQRTTRVFVDNQTGTVAIKLGLYKIASRYNLPSPYINDTGVVVCGIDYRPGESTSCDPWEAGGVHRPIAGTDADYSVQVLYQDGREEVINLTHQAAPADQLFIEVGWVLHWRTATTKDGKTVEVLRADAIRSKTQRV